MLGIAVWFTDVEPGIAVWFPPTTLMTGSIPCFSALHTSEQHPYIHLVSVLCIPVSSIPTSLSFLKSFCPC